MFTVGVVEGAVVVGGLGALGAALFSIGIPHHSVASVAGLLITTEAMVAETPKKDSPAMPGGRGRGDMGGMDY